MATGKLFAVTPNKIPYAIPVKMQRDTTLQRLSPTQDHLRGVTKTAPAFSDVDSAVSVKYSKQAVVCSGGCLSVTPAEVRDFRAKGLQAVDNGD